MIKKKNTKQTNLQMFIIFFQFFKQDLSSIEIDDMDSSILGEYSLQLNLGSCKMFLYPPQNEVLGGYTVFSLSVIP